MIFISSCVNDSSKEAPAGTSSTTTVNLLKASNISPAAFNEDVASIISLVYTDANLRKAQTCTLNTLNKLRITQACSCTTAGVCTVTVIGTPNAYGNASFRYNVSIGGEVSSTGVAAITLTAVDDAPIATNITPALFFFNTQSIMTLAYSDPDGDLATACAISGLSNVTVTQACSCTVSGVCRVGVTGTSNYVGSAGFNFTVTSNSVVSNSAAASFSIIGQAPITTALTPSAFQTNTQSIITLAYTDAQSDQATACGISSARNINLSRACACVSGVCTIGVTSTTNYFGSADFYFTVTAAGEVSNSSIANLTITQSLVATNITPPAFNEDVNSIITLSYSDLLNRKASTCAISGATNVTVNQACACDVAGVCTVGTRGTANYNGAAAFSYTVTAGGEVSNVALATLTIFSIDDPPIVTNATLTDLIYEDIQSGFLVLNYTDVDGDRAGVSDCSITTPANLSVTTACSCDIILGTCSLKITGNANYFGAASFDYSIRANAVYSNVGAINLTITSVEDAPVSTNVTPVAFNEDTPSIITLAYTEVEGDKASSCGLTSLGNVTITQACACDIAGVCTVGVRGTLNFFGAGSFYYTVTANGAVSNSSTAIFTINNVEDAPTVSNTILLDLIYEDIQSGFLVLNYTDVDGDRAGVFDCSITTPANLSVTTACSCDVILGTCSLKITGNANYFGAATFDYSIRANAVYSNVGTVNLSIISVDDAPASTNITPVSFNEDTPSIITLAYTDADNDKASSCGLTSLGNVTITQACACDIAGVCTVGVGGTLNFYGAGSFYYTVTANGAASNSSIASFTINNVDDAPVALAITPPAFDQNVQSIITLSYTDPDPNKANACSISGLSNVTVTQACSCSVAGVCTVGVTGTLNYSGAAAFNYTVTADAVVSNSAAATLTINFVNTAPTINAIAATFGNENSANVVNFTIGDIDGPLACSTANTITVSSNTTLVPLANVFFAGTFPNCSATITPVNNQFGSTNLTFRVTDGGGLFNSTTFIHTVRDGVIKNWNLGGTDGTNTYSYSSAFIESVAPGIIQLAPLTVDQTDDSSGATGFTAIPTTLRWDAANSRIWQDHATAAWTLAGGVYSTSYSSRIMDARKSVSWNSIEWKSTLPFGKELTLTNESTADYSLTTGTLANSLVGLWHFNELAAATAIKNSKPATNGTLLPTTLLSGVPAMGVVGKFNNAITVAGDSIIKSETSNAVAASAFTVSTWVKKTNTASESIFCFWLTSDITLAPNCPVTIANNVISVRVAGTNYNGNTTTLNDGVWHNIIVIGDSSATANTKVYIDGVLETFATNPVNYTFATLTPTNVYLGSNRNGNNGAFFNGSMDETAIWNRVLTAAEALQVYRRGANRLKLAYRTCTDATCSTAPAWSADASEIDNVASGEAIATSPSFAITTVDQRYFQYKATFESDKLPTTHAPNLQNVVVGPTHIHYSAAEQEFVTQEGLSFKSLATFTATLGAQACTGTNGGVRYQLSKDKISWSYHDGTAWAAGTNFATANTSAQIQSGLATYTSVSPTASEIVYLRGILKSDVDGANPCEVDQLQMNGNE